MVQKRVTNRYGERVTETVRKCHGKFGRNKTPFKTSVPKLIKKF